MIEKVDNVVRLSEIILNIVIFGRDAKFYKFILECSALFEEAVNLAFDFHLSSFLVSNPYPQLWPCGWRRDVLPVFVGVSLSSYFYAA